MPSSASRRRFAGLLVCPLFPLAALGCGVGGDAPRLGAIDPAECQRLERHTTLTESATIALVVDNTASTVVSELSPAIRQNLLAAQEHAENVALIGVEGQGRAATVTRTIALDPQQGSRSEAADKARLMTIECLTHWAHDTPMRPTASGSAILDAIAAAARQRPSAILVASDGADTASLGIDQAGLDAEPQDIAREFAASGALPAELSGARIVWSGMGDTVTPLPQRSRNRLTELWRELLTLGGAEAEFRSESGTRLEHPEGLPDDPMLIDQVSTSTIACGTVETIPAGLLFGGDELTLRPGAQEVLDPLARMLSDSDSASATIEGHTAAYGPEAERVPFSLRRAQVVADELVRLGADRLRLDVRGHGSNRPLVDEFPGGVHSETAAARNRRVEITVGAKGCAR